jgi:two-component system, OmpR family, sensor histidine kinase KdpD
MEAAREGERLRTALIDSLTHELRTPLTSIRAAATTLLEAKGLDEAGGWTWRPSSTRRPRGWIC